MAEIDILLDSAQKLRYSIKYSKSKKKMRQKSVNFNFNCVTSFYNKSYFFQALQRASLVIGEIRETQLL